jgi:hypothetical protein
MAPWATVAEVPLAKPLTTKERAAVAALALSPAMPMLELVSATTNASDPPVAVLPSDGNGSGALLALLMS